MNHLEIYNTVRSVPESAKRRIQGGRLSGKTDINPMWRIKVLTELFGPCGIGWYYKTVKQWLESCGEEIAAFVNIELYIKTEGEWSQPIFGTGGSMFAEKERSGIHVSDECFKMATTDAISVACKQLGIGADVYWENDTSKYSSVKEEEERGKPLAVPQEAPANKECKEQRNTSSPPRLPPEHLKMLEEAKQELIRTGYTEKAICNTYKVEDIYSLSMLQLKDFLKKVKNLPDREAG